MVANIYLGTLKLFAFLGFQREPLTSEQRREGSLDMKTYLPPGGKSDALYFLKFLISLGLRARVVSASLQDAEEMTNFFR